MSVLQTALDFGLITLLSVVKTAILLIGGFVTYTCHRAYRNTNDSAFRYLTVGFGFVTVGAFLAGVIYNLGLGLEEGILIESLLVLIGFAVIAYSLYARRATVRSRSETRTEKSD